MKSLLMFFYFFPKLKSPVHSYVHLLLGIYLDVIVVLARQLHSQFTFGLGTPFPQPAHFRGELQVLDRDRDRHRHREQAVFRHKSRREGRKNREEEVEKKGKWRQSDKSNTG